MPEPPVEDLQRYANVLREMKGRIDAARGFLQQVCSQYDFALVDAAAVQLRKVVELVVLASLVTNRMALEGVVKALDTKDAGNARKLAQKANPDYWPVPSVQKQVGPGNFENEPITEGYLTEEAWGPTYGRLSTLVHATNPYLPPPEPVATARELSAVVGELVTLLNHHTIVLVDKDYILMCLMQGEDNGGDVHVSLFERQ
ncbi:MAG: hypothetical protein JWM72_3475 [Actinomycetia bacterium]|nr:hypothetical protein [Actinomycetes bacterium]